MCCNLSFHNLIYHWTQIVFKLGDISNDIESCKKTVLQSWMINQFFGPEINIKILSFCISRNDGSG